MCVSTFRMNVLYLFSRWQNLGQRDAEMVGKKWICRLYEKRGRILVIQNCGVNIESRGVRFWERIFEGSAVRNVQVDRFGCSEEGVVFSSETSEYIYNTAREPKRRPSNKRQSPWKRETSVDCVDSEDGGKKLRRNNCNKLQPIERDTPETVILISNAVATPHPRHQTHSHHLCYHPRCQIPYHQHILSFQYSLTYNTQSLISLTKVLLINNALKITVHLLYNILIVR